MQTFSVAAIFTLPTMQLTDNAAYRMKAAECCEQIRYANDPFYSHWVVRANFSDTAGLQP